ncbi:hypothetical protein [Algoriphagus confluentis]|uniref:IPT/TIG domain-containing protein n=1 Tax=Algoriphagus confluentis TaxID=1697556 RepID=A0ABQ6PMN1_9BACT|nr:hypothetical protein Aconfl_18290 [Algoriphagus confluentis]
MKSRIFTFLFISLLGIACSEEEVAPRTNPRFTVALVQLVDATGAEFSASILDYGSDDILEYGFVYGNTINLTLSNSDRVSEAGKPQKEFKLKATHSMRVGETIYVSAFLRTSEGTVYSKPYSFTSQGSEGFIFERIEVPNEVYFGDTLRVFARNLSKVENKYAAKIQEVIAPIGRVEDQFFEVIIPRGLTFPSGEGLAQTLEVELSVAGKVLKVQQIFSFKAPEILLEQGASLGYTEDLVIKGKYLQDNSVQVKYKNQKGDTYLLDVKGNGDQEIKVGLNALFTELNPSLELIIRGNSYLINNLLALKETVIYPDQKTTFNGFSGSFTLKGENFNPFSIDFNSLEFSPGIFRYQVNSLKSNEMEISFEFNGENPGKRETLLYLSNGGKRSENAFSITWTAPGIPIILFEDFFYGHEGRTVSLGNKGYWISSAGIFEIDPSVSSMKLVAQLPISSRNPSRMFAIAAEGKVYFATQATEETSSEKLFYSFDPATKQVRKLPSIPSEDNSFQSIVYNQGQLYYQGDRIEINTGYDGDIQRYLFDLKTNQWKKLPSLSQHDGVFNFYTSFERNNEIYSASYVAFDQTTRYGTGIFQFNKTKWEWELIRFFENQTFGSWANQSVRIGNQVYFKSEHFWTVVNMDTWQIETPSFWNERYGYAPQYGGFQVGDKFYYFGFGGIVEFDPNYFY